MKTFHILESEVAGDIGDASIVDYSSQPPRVEKLQYKINVWLGDDLLTAHPCFIVTARLQAGLERLAGSGYTFEEVEIATTEFFGDVCPTVELPRFFWMKLHGEAGVDDAGLSKDHRLVVSDRFLMVLRGYSISHCIVRRRPFKASPSSRSS